MKKTKEDYLETFYFPDIPWQKYPVFSVSEKGNLYNLKSIIYPSAKSIKKFTRNKQLKIRSQQAKIFDALINIGYFDPLIVSKEFPIIIQNSRRLNNLTGGYFLLDYFIPNIKGPNFWGLAIELDSDYHKEEKDKLRDLYLNSIGVNVFRIRNLEKEKVQKTKFKEFLTYLRSLTRVETPRTFSFQDEVIIKVSKNSLKTY